MGRYKSRELIDFGIDYVKAYVEFEGKPKILRGLSVNSTMKGLPGGLTYIELLNNIEGYNRSFSIRDSMTGVNLAFCAIGGRKTGNIVRRSFIEVTGQGLILRGGYQWFVNFFEKKLKFHISKYERVDIRVDVGVCTDYFLKLPLTKKFLKTKYTEPYIDKGKTTGLYIGHRSIRENSYQLIRIYNKKLDSHKKNKDWLYDEHDQHIFVTRFEVEVRKDKACFFTTEKLLETNYIFSVIVNTFYGMNIQFFKFLHQEDFQKIEIGKGLREKRLQIKRDRQLRNILYGNDFLGEKEAQIWFKTWQTYTKRLYTNGANRETLYKLIDECIDNPTSKRGQYKGNKGKKS